MQKILGIYAHPYPRQSRANQFIISRVSGLPHFTRRDLYEIYPRYFFDVSLEQKLLIEHQVIYIQHPFYWYNMPALLKEWVDRVFELGFAYGEGGSGLQGKKLQIVITAGGSESVYQTGGANRYSIEEFLRPWEQTARLCGMIWSAPLCFHNARRASEDELGAFTEQVRARLLDLTTGTSERGTD